MGTIERWECEHHGPALTATGRRLPLRWCIGLRAVHAPLGPRAATLPEDDPEGSGPLGF